MKRVLFFSPYAAWDYHSYLEVTWAKALEMRGVDVRFALCNDMSGACDVYRENLNPRTPNSCMSCQANASAVFARLGMPYEWLGIYAPVGMREQAEEWAAAVPAADLLDATWRGMEVGQWAASSAFNQFRTADLDLTDSKVQSIVRGLLVGTVMTLESIEVLFDHYKPDTVALLNGRFYAHWAVIEVAKRKGIRFVAHERGLTLNTVRFNDNSRTHELEALHAIWDRWSEVPLDPREVADTARILEDRRRGVNFSRLVFSPPVQKQKQVRKKLGLDDRPLVAVFTSSDDETAAFPERRAGAFPTSNDFLPAVLKLAESRPELQFVIRIHPNIKQTLAGTNQDAMRHAEMIRDTAPANVIVVMPSDEVSSYTLVEMADLGIVYASTIGLEMAVCGIPVLCVAQATYSHTGCVVQVNDPSEFAPAFDNAMGGPADLEVARKAMRWAYRYFRECSIPFDLVEGLPNDGPTKLGYKYLSALEPGKHQTLDRICEFLAGNSEAVLPVPTDEERGRSLEMEAEALALWMQMASGTKPSKWAWSR